MKNNKEMQAFALNQWLIKFQYKIQKSSCIFIMALKLHYSKTPNLLF